MGFIFNALAECERLRLPTAPTQ